MSLRKNEDRQYTSLPLIACRRRNIFERLPATNRRR